MLEQKMNHISTLSLEKYSKTAMEMELEINDRPPKKKKCYGRGSCILLTT